MIGSAILIALAFLTRYIGVVLVATGALSIWLFSTRSLRQRVVDGVVFGFISAGPMALWLLRNSLAGGTATSRELFFQPLNRQQIGWGLTTLGSWFRIPDTSSALVKVFPYLALGLVVAAVVISRQRRSGRGKSWASWAVLSELPGLIRIILIFIPLYFAFLVVSLTFLDANTPLDSRILSPIYVTGVILALYFLIQAWGAARVVRPGGYVDLDLGQIGGIHGIVIIAAGRAHYQTRGHTLLAHKLGGEICTSYRRLRA